MTSPINPSPVQIFEAPEDLFHGAAEFILGLASKSKLFSIALSGGSTPKGLFQRMVSPEFKDKFPWQKMHFFWGDERWVPHEDPRSNYRMTRETLLEPASIDVSNIHAVLTQHQTPSKTARAYENDLRDFFGTSCNIPRFDLVLLGMGEDGHTASLFPGDAALEEKKKWVVQARVTSEEPRITLTYPVINAAKNILFLVTGENKRNVLQSILKNEPDSKKYPASRIQPTSGHLFWMLDRDASGNTKF